MIIEQIDKNTFDLNLLKNDENDYYFVERECNGSRKKIVSLDGMAMYGIISRLRDEDIELINITR